LPLVARPEPEETLDPGGELRAGVLRKLGFGYEQDFAGRLFVADGGSLDAIEQFVGHEVVFVGLLRAGRAEFRGGSLVIDDGELRQRTNAIRAGFFATA